MSVMRQSQTPQLQCLHLLWQALCWAAVALGVEGHHSGGGRCGARGLVGVCFERAQRCTLPHVLVRLSLCAPGWWPR